MILCFVHRQGEKVHLMEKVLINIKKTTGKHLEYGILLRNITKHLAI